MDRNLPPAADSDCEFPEDFVWGVATSAYQIEGAWDHDGRGESIWDRFTHTPGKVHSGHTGDRAVDHYHRWPRDLELLADLGVRAYRFSIAWPRLLPQGNGTVNRKGLDFYNRLVDELLAREIEPVPTLYHWDLPQGLQDRGGWPDRATAQAFSEYARLVGSQLGDRVKTWITINEPWVSAEQGYHSGTHAPGIRDLDQMLAASHHLLLAHGWAASALRSESTDCQLGIALNLVPYTPASDSEADLAAARLQDGLMNRWYLDPLAGRGYPQDIVAHHGRPRPFVQPEDEGRIAAPIDFLGVNYYMRHVVRSKRVSEEDNEPQIRFHNDERTAMGWEVHPPGLLELLTRVDREYEFGGLVITENGAAYDDRIERHGQVQDHDRISYLQRHLRAAWKAIKGGIPLRGYYLWSLLDNFEWAHGYSKRFGIVHVDFDTLERTPKLSFEWYRQVIDSGRLPSAGAAR